MEAQAKAIASAYCGILVEWLKPQELAAVHAGEAWPDDYCDGNMAMEEAFNALGIPVWDNAGEHMRDDAIDLWNAAYATARDNGFKA